MTLKQMEYFLSVSETLNFAKTAELLYTTQPSVSRQIRALEEELGLAEAIRIGVCNLDEVPCLPKAMRIFNDKYPTVQIELCTDSFQNIVQAIRGSSGIRRTVLRLLRIFSISIVVSYSVEPGPDFVMIPFEVPEEEKWQELDLIVFWKGGHDNRLSREFGMLACQIQQELDGEREITHLWPECVD